MFPLTLETILTYQKINIPLYTRTDWKFHPL